MAPIVFFCQQLSDEKTKGIYIYHIYFEIATFLKTGVYIYIYIYIYIYSENKSSLPNDELPVRGSRGYVSLRKSVDRYNKTTKRQTLDSSSV